MKAQTQPREPTGFARKAAKTLTVDEVWKDYIEQRRPFWGDLHYRDHVDKANVGGLPTWCAEQPAYADLLPAKYPAKTKKAREALGKPGTKTDNLHKSQLAAWFAAVRQIGNPVISA